MVCVTKPAPGVYKPLLEKFQNTGDEAGLLLRTCGMTQPRNVLGKRLASYRLAESLISCRSNGAYCTVWEKEPCVDLFRKVDVMADTLPELADGIILFVA